MKMPEQQASDGAQKKEKQAAGSTKRCMKGDAPVGAQDSLGSADQPVFVYGLGAAKSGVAGEHQLSGMRVASDEAVKNQASVRPVEQDGTPSQIVGVKRGNMNPVGFMNKRMHALAAGPEDNGLFLFQQGRKNRFCPSVVALQSRSPLFHIKSIINKQEL